MYNVAYTDHRLLYSALNDDLVYSTRVKPISSAPIFNAGTERFITDWRTTHVSVVVRDSRMRENDPVLGMVFLKVRLVDESACWYDLQTLSTHSYRNCLSMPLW